MKNKYALFVSVTLLVLVIPLLVCAETAPKYGGTINMVLTRTHAGPIGYPAEIRGDSTSTPQLCFEGLLREDERGELMPWLAESYQVADDYKSVTFNLRKGIKFHDRTDFSAQAVKWNLENTIAAKKQPDWISVDILNDYSIKLNLKQFLNTTLRALADGADGWMASPAAFEKNGIEWMRLNPVGTGPFKFVSFRRDSDFKAIKNPDYWQTGKPYLDGVNISYVVDEMTQKAVMQTGDGDMIPINIGKVSSDMAGLGLDVETSMTTNQCLYPDTENANSPWGNQKVREAVEYAIDREAIAKGLGHGYWQAPYQVPGRDTIAYDPNFSLSRKYNPEKAKHLLSEAGYAEGFTTTIVVSPLGINRNAAITVQSYLSAVGIKVNLEFPDMAKYNTYLYGKMNNAAILGPIVGFANWNATLVFYFSPSRWRLKSWDRTPEFMKLYQASVESPVVDVKLIRAVSEQLTREASVIPVYEAGTGWALQPYVMDSGVGKRGGGPIFWKPEQAWLNK